MDSLSVTSLNLAKKFRGIWLRPTVALAWAHVGSPPEIGLSVERLDGRNHARRRNLRGVFGVGLASARQFFCQNHERLGIRAENEAFCAAG